MTPRLRGRETEQRQILRALHTVVAGTNTVLRVEGGWGSGRTRLLEEVAVMAGRLGFAVVDTGWVAGAEPAALTTRGSSSRPVLVVLDDLHHADPVFVRSLYSLPGRLRDRSVAWILSRRRRAGGQVVDRLFADGSAPGGRVDLRPLPPQVLVQLVADRAGGPMTGAQELLRAAGGNPALAVALACDAAGSGPGGWRRGPSARVRACVLRCVTELGGTCRQLLEVGAVLGSRFTLSDAAHLLHRPAADLLAPLDEVLAADVLVCDGDRLAFAQDLFRQCLLLALPLPARVALAQSAGAEPAGNAVPGSDRVLDLWDAGRAEARDRPAAIRLAAPARQAPEWTLLNDTERRVARLVSQGLTNQQIASQLFRSPHTVNYHLRRMFRKLDIRSRVELARLTLLHYSETADVIDAAG
ncbi:helix-turn-helix transcriptional regulator [Dactylosporangium sp. NPDC050688]|uniref:helix-turn-helix transcriptional regulator n=1 Tax=Dactylosporangium sp. NPDC050688 TaxID=3157217 RepID=UPI0033CB9FDC